MRKSKERNADLTGRKFGQLTVLEPVPIGPRTRYWTCQCDCGRILHIRAAELLNGTIYNCLSANDDYLLLQSLVSGSRKAIRKRIYGIWERIIECCCNNQCTKFQMYGGRGIKVCSQWHGSHREFMRWSFANGYRDNFELVRVDKNKDFCPENCRWEAEGCETVYDDCKITIGNAEKTLREWCSIFEVDFNAAALKYRIRGFISVEDLFKVE